MDSGLCHFGHPHLFAESHPIENQYHCREQQSRYRIIAKEHPSGREAGSSRPEGLCHSTQTLCINRAGHPTDQVCHEIKHRADEDFKGQVYLLANLSCWGHCFNPISFFACYENEVLKYLLAEVHNTPWNERVVYLHQIDHEQELANADFEQCVEFEKQLHVSPFMPMDLKYLWRYKLNKDRFKISMTLRQNDQAIFNASLNLFSQPLTKAKASQLPFLKPFMTLSVLPRIYWQAFKLWLKKVPTYQHPAK